MTDAQYGYSSGASVASSGYGSQYGSYGNDSYGSYGSSGTAGSASYGSTAPYAQQSGYQSTAGDQYSGYSTQSQPSIYDGQSAPSGYYSTGASGGAAGGGQSAGFASSNNFGANAYYTSHGGSHPPGGQSSQSYGQFGSGGGSGQYGGQSAQSQMSGYNMPPGPMPGGPGGPYTAGPGGHYGGNMTSHGPPFHDGLGPGMRAPPNSNFRGGHGGGRNSGPGFMNKGRGGGFGGPSDYGMQDYNQDTIFISGLPSDVTEDQLAQHFGQIGVIKIDKKTNKPKIWIYRDKISGKGKGEATLTYDDPHTAKSAIDWFSGKEFPGSGKVTVDFAQRKSSMDGGFGGSFRGNRGGGNRGGRGGPGGPRSSDGSGRQGDWRCPVPTCNNNNFAWRNECNRCKTPRPAGDTSPGPMTPNVIDGSPRRGGLGMGGPRGGGGGPRGSGRGTGGVRGGGGGRGGPGGGRGGRGGPPRGGGMGGRGGPMGGGGGGPMRSTPPDRRLKPY